MNPLHNRCAGILLHPTSLPGSRDCGNIGVDARRFVDFLQSAGMSVWQMLPLGPTHADHSPYQCLSAHAGNTRLICIEDLVTAGWLDQSVAGTSLQTCLGAAREGFEARAGQADREAYRRFRAEHHHWLDDYALYAAIRQSQDHQPWYTWPDRLRNCPQARAAQHEYAALTEQVCFDQFLFFRQWQALRDYARERAVALFGDMPIYVAHDSADAWSSPELFTIDDRGQLEMVAGVPPDYFSQTGQRWGNPLFRWQALEDTDYQWWVERFTTQLGLFDLIRLDHFRGFEKFWEIPAAAETAVDGRWVEGPGNKLFDRLLSVLGELPVVAEDLGIITPEVEALRQAYDFPGMKILQFAFDGGEDNPYLPQNHDSGSVVYTGTHDNDTTLGWFRGLDEAAQGHVREYLTAYANEIPWSLIELAMDSIAKLAIIPMQDVLSLDTGARMNTPGTLGNNWQWRLQAGQLDADSAARLHGLVAHYQRLCTRL